MRCRQWRALQALTHASSFMLWLWGHQEPGKRLSVFINYRHLKSCWGPPITSTLLVSDTSWQWAHVFVQDKTIGTRKGFPLSLLPTTNESLTITFNSHPMVETKKGLCLEEGYNTLLTLWLQCPPQNINYHSHHQINNPTQSDMFLCYKLLNMFTLQ